MKAVIKCVGGFVHSPFSEGTCQVGGSGDAVKATFSMLSFHPRGLNMKVWK